MVGRIVCFFFFKQKTSYEMRISDWSSDVCSSDLIRRSHGFRAFDRQAFREIVAFSIPIAQTIIRPGQMAGVIVDELRRRQILLPSPSILEAVLRRARQQAEQLTYEVLTNGLQPDTIDRKSTRLNSRH